MRELFCILCVTLCDIAAANAQWGERMTPVPFPEQAIATDRMAVDDMALRTREGLDEDYMLAQQLIMRMQQRRAEAARLNQAALDIEMNNARLREFLCTRFCQDRMPVPRPRPFPAQPMFPTREVPLDPAFFPGPVAETDMQWRGAGFRMPIPRREFEGTFNVQVQPRGW